MTDADLAHKIRLASFRRQTRQAAAKQNQLVPENTVAGNALTVVIAIMSFLACLTLGAVTLVRDASRDWQLDVQREVTIQVKLSSMSVSIWKPPATSRVENPCRMLRSIRRAWISWVGSSR